MAELVFAYSIVKSKCAGQSLSQQCSLLSGIAQSVLWHKGFEQVHEGRMLTRHLDLERGWEGTQPGRSCHLVYFITPFDCGEDGHCSTQYLTLNP